MKTTHRIAALLGAVFALVGCASQEPAFDPRKDYGHAWVTHSADYAAITRQVYAVATRDLERFVQDTSWSALPGQTDAAELPPAVILDVDETVINNAEFQVAFERPFTDRKLEMWDREHIAKPVPGVVEFVAAAREAGVTVFFMTNRPCEQYEGETDPCPQKQTVIDGIRELGIPVQSEFVMLALEQPGWTGEKVIRRKLIGQDYRVIQVIGDDFADFVACARHSYYPPCTEPATRASRRADLDRYGHYWGNGWYILPGPMHGSWRTVR